MDAYKSNQEVFDASVADLLAPGREPAYDYDSGQCIYSMDNGNRCAIGALMLGRVSPECGAWTDQSNVGGILDSYEEVAVIFEGIDRDLLSALQGAHDLEAHEVGRSITVEEWRVRLVPPLVSIANSFSLAIPETFTV